MLDLNVVTTYGSGVFITNKLILGVLMQRIQRMIQLGCFTLILAFGGIHFSAEDAKACEDGGTGYLHEPSGLCLESHIQDDCIICISDPIED